jgi:hypothetical protein
MHEHVFQMLRRAHVPRKSLGTANMSLQLVFYDPDGYQHAFRDMWYPVGLSDPSAFHIVLSNSVAHFNSARIANGGQPSAENEEMLHYDLAIRCVNDRIGNAAYQVTDGIIGAITGFICHNVCSPRYVFRRTRLTTKLSI